MDGKTSGRGMPDIDQHGLGKRMYGEPAGAAGGGCKGFQEAGAAESARGEAKALKALRARAAKTALTAKHAARAVQTTDKPLRLCVNAGVRYIRA